MQVMCVPIDFCSKPKNLALHKFLTYLRLLAPGCWELQLRFFQKNKQDFLSSFLFLYLSLGKTHAVCQLCFPTNRDVSAIMELLLQLEPLVVAVYHSVLVFSSSSPCKSRMENVIIKIKIQFQFLFRVNS